MTTIVILFRSQKQGYDIDILAFAAALDVSRTSAHRLLQDWQREEVVTLKKWSKDNDPPHSRVTGSFSQFPRLFYDDDGKYSQKNRWR